jgi:hypothetical protein
MMIGMLLNLIGVNNFIYIVVICVVFAIIKNKIF